MRFAEIIKLREYSRANLKYLNEYYRLTNSNEYSSILGINQNRKIFYRFPILFKLYGIAIICSYPIVLIIWLIKAIINVFQHHKNWEANSYFLLTSTALPRVIKRLPQIPNNYLWLETPWLKTLGLDINKTITVFDVLGVYDIIISFLGAIIMFYYFLFKKGPWNVLLEYYDFQWLLFFQTLQKIDDNKELYFCSHMDNWVPLIDNHKSTKKYLIQHGTLIHKKDPYKLQDILLKYIPSINIWCYNIPYKYRSITKVYSFTDNEYTAVCSSILANDVPHETVGLSIELQPQPNDKINVLIIGYYPRYNVYEEKLINVLTKNKKIRVYLKNHPTVSSSNYDSLRSNFDFVFINDATYPDADLVFSYESTLALEYKSMGKNVYLYDEIQITDDNIKDIINKLFNHI